MQVYFILCFLFSAIVQGGLYSCSVESVNVGTTLHLQISFVPVANGQNHRSSRRVGFLKSPLANLHPTPIRPWQGLSTSKLTYTAVITLQHLTYNNSVNGNKMDLDATPAERKQLEYASQHFGFTPDSLTETITIYALDHMTDVLKVS